MRNVRNYWNNLEQTTRNRIISVIGVCVIVGFCLFVTIAWPKISGKPLLVLNGESEVTVAAGADFTDEGAEATLLGKSVSDRIYETGEVDTSVPGTYELHYNVDGRWQTYTVTRKVTVVDETAPEITLNGDASVTVDRIEDYVEQARTYLEANYMRDVSIGELAGKLNLNRSYFSALFRKKTGKSRYVRHGTGILKYFPPWPAGTANRSGHSH